jgi:SAM-dependent methyltransferase
MASIPSLGRLASGRPSFGRRMTEYWDSLDHHTDVSEIWMSHPLVRRRINFRISGDESLWPTAWLASRLRDRAPIGRAASIGCGIGNFERDVVSQGLVARITGVDASPQCVDEATILARRGGLDSRISYQCADAREWLSNASELDAVFFHQSLHHFDRLDHLLELVTAALGPGGVLYLDEYVGPSRDEWRLRHFLLHNLAYQLLPWRVRRARLVRAPVNRQDPTEAINSSQILSSVERHFDILERRDYGGNLVSVIYPNLRRPDDSPASAPRAFDQAVATLLNLEDWALRHGRLWSPGSYYTVVIARSKKRASAAENVAAAAGQLAGLPRRQ